MIEQSEAPSRPAELVAQLHALLDELSTVDLTGCGDAELIDVAASNEQAISRLTYAGDRQLVEITDRDLPHTMGHRSAITFFNQRLRISNPQRRRAQMAATATFTQMTGQTREPACPALADAFAHGAVGTGHITAVLDVLDQLPNALPHDVRAAAERQMAEHATELTPTEITAVGQRLLAHVDPDGTLVDDADRARRRTLSVHKQRADGTAKLSGVLDPILAARLTMMLAVWARPGMNNPQDPDSPSGSIDDADPEQVAAAADRDYRTQPQRNHDAMTALLKAVFEDGLLGTTHRGLPPQLIIKADLGDLIAAAGLATTATATTMPITDLIALAAEAQPWLAVFADSTPIPLFFGQGRRFASTAQRLVNFARPDGHLCSAPGCDQPAAHLEIHHAQLDWARGGFTDITDLTGACPKHNRMVGDKPGQYTTRMITSGDDAGRCAWQLNNHPGAPPNPEQINRAPDVAAEFAAHLARVRAEIHGPPDPPPRFHLREIIHPESVIETRLADLLAGHLGLVD